MSVILRRKYNVELIKNHFEYKSTPIKFGVCLIPAGKSFEKEDFFNVG